LNFDLESDVRCLRDQAEIKDIVHRFVTEADKRSAEGMVNCVSDDVVVSFNDGAIVIEGAEKLREYLIGQFAEDGTLNPHTRGTHAMSNTVITLNGDSATAETSGITCLATPAGMVHIRGVFYRDKFARIDGKWRLADRRHSCGWQIDTEGRVAPPLLV